MMVKKIFLVLTAALLILGASGCGEDSPMEKAGKQADEAAKDANKKIKKLMD